MREETHEALRRLFEQAIDLPPGERVARLDRECPPALRPRLEAVLAAAECDDTFLADPPTVTAPTFEAPVSPVAGAQIGPYKLLQQIGEGGFGAVFLAEQRTPVQRRVALKVIKLGMDTKAVIARFEAERQALALMDHPNIAHVLEAGATDTGRPYFVMELVKGEPITRYCDTLSLGLPERLALFMQVCHAVQHAHGKGVIHRDLKPSNILVSTQDGRPLSKVIDFGIAKATDHRLTERTLFTEHRALIGTPEYMSPEQAEGSLDIDTRSDVYALGVLLYELLTGATPFDARQLRAGGYRNLQRIIREEEPQKPSTRVSTLATLEQVALQRCAEPKRLGKLLRGDLDWIVMRCLEKERSRRYETAVALAEDVRRHLASEPVLAGPPGTRYRLRKFVGRHKVGVAAGSLVAATLVLGLTGTSAGMAWALREQVRAEERRVDAEDAQGREREQRELAENRAKETQQVADFQAAMLNGIDVEAMGRGIKERFREKVREALERQWVGEYPDRRPRTPEEIEAEMAAFDQRAGAAQAVDVARGVMDEFVLARAAEALEEQFAAQPLVRADLHNAIGATYMALGLYSAAEPHLGAAMELCRRELGDKHPHTLISIANMGGGVLLSQGRYAEAEAYLREVLDERRRALGNDDLDTLRAVNGLGLLFHSMGRYTEAERYYQEALEGRRRELSNDHLDTLTSINNMGALLRSMGKLDEAEPLCREAVDGSRRALGNQDRDTLTSINNLGDLLRVQGKLAEAEPYYKEALDGRRSLHGNEHRDTLASIGGMGLLLHDQDKLAEAEPYYSEALEGCRRAQGDAHPDTLVAINNMGYLLQDLGKLAEAQSLFAEGTQTARVGLGSHPQTASLEHHYASVLLQRERFDEAIDFAQAAADRYRAHPEWSPHEAAHALQVLTDALLGGGRQAEALEVWWERILVVREQSDKPPADLASALATFGAEALAAGDRAHLERAEQALRDFLDIRRAVLPDGHPQVWQRYNAMSVLGEVLVRQAADPTRELEARIATLHVAERLLLDAWERLKDDPNVPPASATGGTSRRQEAVERIVKLYDAWHAVEPDGGHDANATQWRAELEKLSRS